MKEEAVTKAKLCHGRVQICNRGLKLMLNEDTNGLMDFQGMTFDLQIKSL